VTCPYVTDFFDCRNSIYRVKQATIYFQCIGRDKSRFYVSGVDQIIQKKNAPPRQSIFSWCYERDFLIR
jgi:hypothetical protein